MESEDDSGIGVKMLADHLVKVKQQYEEQINEMREKVKSMENERDAMRKQVNNLEEEVDARRNEIYRMKRAGTAQYVVEERENWKAIVAQQKQENAKLEKDLQIYRERVSELQKQVAELEERSQTTEPEEEIVIPILPEEDAPADGDAPVAANEEAEESAPDDLSAENKKLMDDLCRMKLELQAAQRTVEETKVANTQLTDQFIRRVDAIEHDHQERENALLASIEALKLKLNLELEKKWELMQELREEEEEENQRGGLISYLWG
ncbi:hypothetical protein WA556_001078 [Blastocystis sp. ATCC 50177/Nand II]